MAIETDDAAHHLAEMTVAFYGDALTFGGKYVFTALPRLLTLWFEVSLLREPDDLRARAAAAAAAQAAGRSANARTVPPKFGAGPGGPAGLSLLQHKLNERVRAAVAGVPAHLWFTVLQQLASRVGHPDPAVVDVVVAALVRVATEHPREAVWGIAALLPSQNDARRKAGRQVRALSLAPRRRPQ